MPTKFELRYDGLVAEISPGTARAVKEFLGGLSPATAKRTIRVELLDGRVVTMLLTVGTSIAVVETDVPAPAMPQGVTSTGGGLPERF